MTFKLDHLTAYILVLVRMTGMIAFNPVFNRRNVPAIVRSALVLCLTILLAPVAKVVLPADGGTLPLLMAMFRELFIGAACAFVFLVFYYMLFFAGDLMDMQFGLSMARVFDPGTSIQASISGNLFHILFILFFFATDSHLVLIRVFLSSYELIPAGSAVISGEISGFMLSLFASAFSLAFRLAMPFIAVEFVLEIAMGVLMKLIPQIHVFVINMQIKILAGIFMLLVFCQPIADFVDRYMHMLFKGIEGVLMALGG